MKVLFVLENYHPKIGGVETLFKLLCETLAQKGHEVRVITTHHPGLATTEVLNGVHIQRLRITNRYLFTFLAFGSVFKWTKWADFVHTTSYNAGFPAGISGLILRKKVVITFHEVWGKLWLTLPFMPYLSKWAHRLYEWALLRIPFYRFVAVSEFTKNALRSAGIAENRIVRIYNGVDYADIPKRLEEPDNTVFTYTYYGRLGISKGLDVLLKAAHRFRKDIPASKLQIITAREPVGLLRQVQRMINELNLEDYVTLIHHLPFTELVRHIHESDCVVIPSYSEGFCFVAAETVAMNVPIISSHRGALPEVVSGRHIEMETLDSDALYRALVQARAGEYQHSPKRKYTLEENINGHLSLYEAL